MSDEERRLVERVTTALDEGVANIDGATRAHLREARRRALAPRHEHRGWWLSLGGAVLTSVLVATLWLGRPVTSPAPVVPLEPQDFDLLTATDSLELYRDLDFYRWLAAEVPHAG